MGLAIMVLGLAVFVAAHVFITRRDARAAVIGRIGEGPYKGLLSLVSLIGVVLIAWGFARYRATGWVDVWLPPPWTRHVTVALMWPAIVLDRISLKSRTDPGGPQIPVGGWGNDVAAVIVGTLVYLALGFVFHPLVIGVPAFTG